MFSRADGHERCPHQSKLEQGELDDTLPLRNGQARRTQASGPIAFLPGLFPGLRRQYRFCNGALARRDICPCHDLMKPLLRVLGYLALCLLFTLLLVLSALAGNGK